MRKLLLAFVPFLAAMVAHADPLLPTAEGTTWEYVSTESLTGAPPVRSVVTVRVGKQLFDGKEVAKFDTLSNNVVSKTELLSVDANGVACLARSGKDGKIAKLNPPEPIIASPLKVGASWELESEVMGIKMHQHFSVVGEENVTVPAGDFRAFHLQCEDSSLMSIKLDRWFAPGTGVVKETTVVRGPGMLQRVTLELNKITEVIALPPVKPSPAAPEPAEQPPSEPAPSPVEEAAGPAKKLTVEVSDVSGGESKNQFKSDVTNIYVRWHGHDLPEGAHVRVAWVAEDVGDLVEPNFVVDETETIAPGPNASARFTLGRPPDGWADGKYRLEFYIDDFLTETVHVTILK
jgi:hypothetical protein